MPAPNNLITTGTPPVNRRPLLMSSRSPPRKGYSTLTRLSAGHDRLAAAPHFHRPAIRQLLHVHLFQSTIQNVDVFVDSQHPTTSVRKVQNMSMSGSRARTTHKGVTKPLEQMRKEVQGRFAWVVEMLPSSLSEGGWRGALNIGKTCIFYILRARQLQIAVSCTRSAQYSQSPFL